MEDAAKAKQKGASQFHGRGCHYVNGVLTADPGVDCTVLGEAK
jgi:hypothetical protein